MATSHSSTSEVSPQIRDQLIDEALKVRQNAYAPYSKFLVGAALLCGEDGKIYTGANVENVSYGLCNCAERSAIFTMASQGKRTLRAIAIATSNGTTPCGACRQVLAEFMPKDGSDVPVFIADHHRNVRDITLRQLLPDICQIDFDQQ